MAAARAAVRTVYVYFNNDVGGHALVNARELQEMPGVGAAAGRRRRVREDLLEYKSGKRCEGSARPGVRAAKETTDHRNKRNDRAG
jgi:hypothetical protein